MLARFSVKKPYTVIVGIILVIALGVISFINMTTDLLPSMDLPYIIVYATYTGATPEKVESDVTRPMEGAFATLTDVKNISSTSSENVSMVVMEFEAGADMNTAMIEINSEIETLSADWDDAVGAPVIMRLNPDMLPVTIATVSLEDADLLELSDYVQDELIPKYEAVDGVARVSASGILTQQVDITIEQERIDVINNAILRELDAELGEVEMELRDAMDQLEDGKNQLARAKGSAYGQIGEAMNAIEQGSQQLPQAIAELTAKRDELSAQLESAKTMLSAMEAMLNLPAEDRAELTKIIEELSKLELETEELEKQLASLGDASTSALQAQLKDAQAQRDEQIALKASLEAYLEDLKLLDAASLQQTVTRLEGEIAAGEAEISAVRGELEAAIAKRDAAALEVADLEIRLGLMDALQPTQAPTAAPTAEITPEATANPAATMEAAKDEALQPTPEASAEPTASAVPTLDPAAAAQEIRDQLFSLAEQIFGGSAQAEGENADTLRAQLEAARAKLETARQEADALSARHDALREAQNTRQKALEEAKKSLEAIQDGDISVQSRIEATQAEIDSCNARIAELDKEIEDINAMIAMAGSDGLRKEIMDKINANAAQIEQIKNSEEYKMFLQMMQQGDLEASYAQAKEAVAQLEAGIASIDSMLEKLNAGVIPGGLIEGVDQDTNLSDAKAQLQAAQGQAAAGFAKAEEEIAAAEEELSTAWTEFTRGRDEAFKNAGIDGIITTQTVSAILGSQNLDLPAGYAMNGDERYLVSIGREFASLDELKQLKLFSLGLETVDDVRLLDVASVEISDNSAELFTLVNGENGIMISFEKQSTASTAEVAGNITAESERLMAANSRLKVTEMMNQGDYIDLIVSSVLDNLVSGGILAIAILLLFLLDWKPTLIVALSIPASVVVAFVCMYFTGITLNVMSLSGLAIGIGMLVDNSIVSIENIYRLKDEEGLPVLTSCIRGVNQVAGALFSSTLTTICVFLPVVFIEGMARDLFSDMGLTIAFSLLASLVVSMTVVPSFAAGLFKKSKPKKQRIFGWFQRVYTGMLRGALKAKILVILISVGLLAFTVVQVMDMPMSFMPSVNSEQMSASLSFENPDIPEDERQAAAIEIMDRMLGIEGVNDVSLSAGDSMSLMGGSDYTYYILVEPGLRKNADIARDMRAAAAEFADGGDAVFGVQESTMDLTSLMGSGITVNISGENIDELRAAARDIAALCAQVPGAENIDDGSESAEPKMMITVNKELASDHSLSVAQVYQHVATKLYGAVELTNATLDGREYTIYVAEDQNIGLTTDAIEDMMIEVAGEEETKFVRIGDIADISYGESLSSISRNNQRRTTGVSFEIADGYSANLVSRDLEALLDGYQPPAGCEVSLGGENESVMEYMGDLGLMLLIAVLFIFLIMVAQFQSFKSPFIVMFTIPLAFTGGLLALIITGMDLSIIAMLGFLVLSGVVVNNGIVFVDSVNQLRIGGMSKRDALIETGRIRLRPILMTALTTILGMSTMALATGMGAEMMQPMAVVIVGGLLYSTLMTLFVVPVLYDIFNGETMKAREIEMMKEAAGMHRDGFDGDAVPAEEAPAPAPAPAPVPAADPIPAPAAPSAPVPKPTRVRIRLK